MNAFKFQLKIRDVRREIYEILFMVDIFCYLIVNFFKNKNCKK